jgi:23S rRNA pseudouridine2605 synthase
MSMNDAIEFFRHARRQACAGHPCLYTPRQMNERSDKAGDRIAKVIARAGLTSRREAEQWIAAGRVSVNGAVIHSPALNVAASDRISVDGEPLPTRERTRLFLYHKPRGLLTTRVDPRGRPTVFEHLPKDLPRLISVGRLDFSTEGLLLLTNDGELARLLELPATGWLRRYRVRAHGSVTQAKLDELRGGVDIDGMHYGSVEATLDRVQGSNLWLTFAIREGKNREVRNVLGHLGLTVARLIRVSFGPFALGELAEGAVEEVPTRVLREQLGERLVALSGADFSTPLSPRRSESKEQTRPQTKRKSPGRGVTSHSWRAHENDRPAKKLKRKFHGARRNDNMPRERAAAEGKRGELIDRKGRRVTLERYGAPPEQMRPASTKYGARHGQRPRFGKSRGSPRRR